MMMFGGEFISFDLSNAGAPILSNNDFISFSFQTSLQSTLIFYTGRTAGTQKYLYFTHVGSLKVLYILHMLAPKSTIIYYTGGNPM